MRNYDKKYKNWIKQVRSRDKNQCQWPRCLSKKSLQTHHIFPWCDYIGLRYDINNGITLCKAHHKLIYNDEIAYAGFFRSLIYNKELRKDNKKE